MLAVALTAFGALAHADETLPLAQRELLAPPDYLAWVHRVATAREEPGTAALETMLADAPGRRLLTRIAAVDHLRVHPHPSLGPALMRTFARARFGELPEDPDLFEGALRAVQALPEDAQQHALQTGLGPVLARLAFADLSRRWLAPALAGQPPAVRSAVLDWPAREPASWTALEDRITADLDTAWDAHGSSLLPAMSVEGGSIAHIAARQVDDAVMAALLDEAPAAARAALVGVAADRGEDGPALHAALERLAREDPRLAPAVAGALLGLTGQPLPPMAPPAIAPGRVPGLELRSPAVGVGGFRAPGSGPVGTTSGPALPAAAGIGLVLLAGLAGARARSRLGRGLAALVLSVALLTVAEAGARIAGTKLLADSEPLLSFIPQGAAVLSIPPTGETGWRQTAGGSIRAALFSATPEPGRTRVAFVGASTVHGSHALADETFAAVSIATANSTLGAPGMEGINLGVGGATSSVIRAAAQAALDAGAHVLVFYYGHNEVDQFIRLGRYAGIDASVLRARSLLRQSSLYSAIRGMLPERAPAAARPDPTGPPDRAEIASLKRLAQRHHASNLEAMLRSAERAGAEVIIARTATNYRFAHLEPHPTPGPGDASDLQAWRTLGDERANAGDREGARQAWQRAIDASAWPRETTSAIDAATRALGERYGCAMLDVGGLVAAHSPDGVTASGMFWDDLHPTPLGHRIIGESLAPLLVQAHERRQ